MHCDTAIKALDIYLENDIPVFLWGAPGIGKTQMIYQLGKERNRPVIDYRLLLRDSVDLRGLPDIDRTTGQTTWRRPSDLPFEGNDCADEGYLFLDELNAAPPSLQAVGFGLVEERKIADNRLKPGWRVIGAGNRVAHRAAAQPMPSALANRFAHLDVEPDIAAWSRWANGAGIAPVLVALLRLRPNLLHCMEATGGDLRAFPTPRSWEKVSRFIMTCPDELRFPMVAGIVGEGAAAECIGFMQVWRNLPTIADIIANPDRINIPNDPSTLYAVSTALARKADRANFAPIIRFANRALGCAHTVMLVTDAVRRDGGLRQTSAFVQWASDNADVTI